MIDQREESGVQQLINRLREQGVASGQAEADRLLEAAHQKAAALVEAARKEAEAMRVQARDEAAHLQKSAHEALQLAARDTVLHLKNSLTGQFVRRLGEMVANTLNDEQFLEKLILEVASHAGGAFAEGEVREVLLPKDIVGLQELRRHPEKVKEGPLSQFVLSVTGDLLREGVTLKEGSGKNPGIRVYLVDQKVEVDLTTGAVQELLLDHMLPRFRALLEGSIQ